MKITHLQSSTQIITVGNTKVLTDPWLTEGEYYGSWYHYPPFSSDDLSSLEYDYIYVSHIHPDHLSEETFRRLPLKKPVLIHNYASKFVKRKLEMLGYEVIECNHNEPYTLTPGGSITIYAADNCNPELCSKMLGCGIIEKKFGSTQIDTLAVFEYQGQRIINTNDCPYELASETIKKNNLTENIDFLLVGYAGAGPYPQCFEFDNVDNKRRAAGRKEKQFLDQAIKYINLVKPKTFAPFAGTYVLGSRLFTLTEFRGVPALDKALEYLEKEFSGLYEGILFEQCDSYDLDTQTFCKSEAKFDQSYSEYIANISKKSLMYDTDNWDDDEIGELINAAYSRFKAKAEEINFSSETKLIIQSDKFAYQLSTESAPILIAANENLSGPFVRISADHNLLHRLLRGPRYAHWNNAEIGSHLRYERKPDIFERGLYHCMCFLHK